MIDRAFESVADGAVTVRRLRADDIPTLVEYRSDPAVAQWQGWGDGFTAAQGHSLWKALADDHPGELGEWFQFAIEHEGRFVGDIGVFFESQQRATIGYTVAPAFQRQGIATRAVGLIISYLKDSHGITTLNAGTLPNNVASIALLSRLGFVRQNGLNDDGEATFELDLTAS